MNYNKLNLLGCRVCELEKNTMACSIMDLLAYQPEIFRAMTGAIKRGNSSVFPGGQFEVRHKFCQSSSVHGLTPFMYLENFLNVSQACESQFVAFYGGIDRIMNLLAKFSMLRATRLGQLRNSEPFSSDMDICQAKKLAKHFNIKYGWNYHWRKESENFWQSITPSEDPSFYSVYDFDGVLIFQFIVIQGKKGYAILPITMFRNNNYQHSIVAHVPPSPPYSFFNEHALKEYPFAHIYLTDDIALAFENPPSCKRIYLVNIGGEAWIDGLNFALLRGREVTCMANNIAMSERGIMRIIELFNAQGINPAIEQNPRLVTTVNIPYSVGGNNYGC